MIVPKANIWQSCRNGALDTIPQDCPINFKQPLTLSDWRQRGSFRVTAVNARKGLDIECSSKDIGEAVLGDVDSLLNHMAEHRANVFYAQRKDSWSSPAWLLVTIYYWGFFAALAWTRILGKGMLYLDGAAVEEYCSLLTPGIKGPGAGAYQFESGAQISASDKVIYLNKLKQSHFHTSVWQRLFMDIRERFSAYADEDANQLEYRMFKCLVSKASIQDLAWPSVLRNAVNYHAGFAYREVTGTSAFDLASFIRKNPFNDIDDVIDRLEMELGQISGAFSVDRKCLPAHCRILYLSTVLLTTLCEELFGEVVERRGLDRRFDLRRKAFFRRRAMCAKNSVWPYSVPD